MPHPCEIKHSEQYIPATSHSELPRASLKKIPQSFIKREQKTQMKVGHFQMNAPLITDNEEE